MEDKSYSNLVIQTPLQMRKEKKRPVSLSKGGFIPSGEARVK